MVLCKHCAKMKTRNVPLIVINSMERNRERKREREWKRERERVEEREIVEEREKVSEWKRE